MGSPDSELRDNICIAWDTPIHMDDGISLSADVFCPAKAGPHPVILTYGAYAKELAFQEGCPSAWRRMIVEHPDVAYGSTNRYQVWEVVDPDDRSVFWQFFCPGCGAPIENEIALADDPMLRDIELHSRKASLR